MSENLADRIEALDAKATAGPWEVDSEYDDEALYSGGGGCGRGFKNFFVGAEIKGEWATLLDTQNSDNKLIEEDFDEDGKSSWDENGRNNAELVATLRNAVPTILSALRLAERLDAAEVTQMDQDAAWQLAERLGVPDITGPRNQEEIAEHFARHREAALRLAETSSDGGWIVGNSDGTKWRAWASGGPVWVDNRTLATRYFSRADAEAVHGEDEDAWSVVPYGALADRVETSAALPNDVAGLVEDAKQLAECLDYPDARRTVFGLIATLTAQSQRIAELEAENAEKDDMLRLAAKWFEQYAIDHEIKAGQAVDSYEQANRMDKARRNTERANEIRAALKGGRDEA